MRFEGYNEIWTEKRLDEIVTIERGRFSPRPRNNPIYYNGNIPFIQTSDVVNSNGKIDNYSQTLNEKGLKVSKLFPKGTIMITIAANIGHSGVLKKDMACPDSLVGLECGKDTNNIFLNYILTKEQPRMDYLAVAAAQKNINIEFLKPFKVYIPALLEQIKVATFLTLLDERIQTQNKIIEDYKLLKEGLRCQFFKQELKFKDKNGDYYPKWRKKKLKEILNYEQPTKYLVSDSEYSDKYLTPVLTAGKTFLLGYTNEKDGIYNEKLPVIIFDDFTTAIKYVDFPFKVKSSAMKMLTPKFETLNLKFIYEAMKTIKFPLAEHKRYWISEYQNEEIPYPPIAEQNKIAMQFSSIDKKIELEFKFLDKLEQQKNYLLQNLFI